MKSVKAGVEPIRAYPVTFAIVAATLLLELAVAVWGWWSPEDSGEARRALGAVRPMSIVRRDSPAEEFQRTPQFNGAFDLWDGEFWRIPVSGFHHAGLVHLATNALAILFLGVLVESRMRRLSYAAFFLTATTVSLLPEFLADHYAVGLSGGAYAMFGLLLVLRQDDWRIAAVMTPAVVWIGILWLVACVVLTYTNVLPVANFAHFTGIAYGWTVGRLFFAEPPAGRLARAGFLAGHVLLVPAFYLAVHPFWVGRYHWYLAYESDDPAARAAHLADAVRWDPCLQQPWRELADHYAQRGRTGRAWETILNGLDANRTDEQAVRLAVGLWKGFAGLEQRREALEMLATVFGNEAPQWRERLGLPPPEALGEPSLPLARLLSMPNLPETPAVEADDSRLAFERRFGRESSDRPPEHTLAAPEVDPHAPGSAAEGVTL